MAERIKRLYRVTATHASGDGVTTYQQRRDYQTYKAAEHRAQVWLQGQDEPPTTMDPEDNGWHVEPALRVTIQQSAPVEWVGGAVEIERDNYEAGDPA